MRHFIIIWLLLVVTAAWLAFSITRLAGGGFTMGLQVFNVLMWSVLFIDAALLWRKHT